MFTCYLTSLHWWNAWGCQEERCHSAWSAQTAPRSAGHVTLLLWHLQSPGQHYQTQACAWDILTVSGTKLPQQSCCSQLSSNRWPWISNILFTFSYPHTSTSPSTGSNLGVCLQVGRPWLPANTSWKKIHPHERPWGAFPQPFPLCIVPQTHTHTHRVQQRAITKTMFFSNSCLTWAGRGHGQPESAPLPWVAPRGDSLALPHHVVMVKELLGGPQLTLVARGSHTL